MLGAHWNSSRPPRRNVGASRDVGHLARRCHRRCTTRRWRASSPRCRSASSTISASGASSGQTRTRPAASRIASGNRSAAVARPPARRGYRSRSRTCGRRSTSRLPADRPRPRRRGRPRATRRRRRCAAACGSAAAHGRTAAQPRVLGGERPQPPQLGRHAGQHDHRRAGRPRARAPGAVPAMPSTVGPVGDVRLLQVAGRKPLGVEPRPLRHPFVQPVTVSEHALRRPPASTPQARAIASTVRSSCVGPRPPR